MKKYIYNILLGAVVCGLISGCLPEKGEDALVYNGPTVVEIKNQNLGVLAATNSAKGIYTTTALTDSSRTVLLNSRGIDSILVQLVGGQRSEATVINYSVRTTAPAGLSAAVEGTNYDFIPTGARSVTIPANASSAYIRVNLIPNSMTTVGQTRTVSLDLLGNNDIQPSANYKKFILSIRR